MKLLRFLLFPFAILYDLITKIRNYCYSTGIFKSFEFNIPVIAVGNLSVGGTGKTPQIEFLVNLLTDNYRVAVLSRGYKRKTKEFQIVNNSHKAKDVGDEPLQLFKKFRKKITVAVDTNRANGIKQLLKTKHPPELVLLDDAFQHRKVKATLYILLTKYKDLYVNDFILPTGNLRESKKQAKRANIIVVTKCPGNISKKEQKAIIKKINPKKYQQVFFSSILYNEELQGNKKLTIKDLKNKKVLLITGIANPSSLVSYLLKNQVNYKHMVYPDHHNFTKNDIRKITNSFQKIKSEEKIILTTEKDYMRLSDFINNIYVIKIKTKLLADENEFIKSVYFHIKKPFKKHSLPKKTDSKA